MGSPARYACCGKEMLGWIRKKIATPESAPRLAGFLPPAQSSLETTLQLATTHVLQVGTTELPLGIVPGSTHIHPTCQQG
jgi:hypothetical protein